MKWWKITGSLAILVIGFLFIGGCFTNSSTGFGLDERAISTKCALPSNVDNSSSQTITRSYPYVVDGQKGSIELTLNKQWRDFFECRSNDFGPPLRGWTNRSNCNFGKCINTSTYVDSEIVLINETKKYSALKPLIDAIKLKSTDPKMQARIAINLVQQIPYNSTKQESIDANTWHNVHFDTPYEVLYSNSGQCTEKSTLLAALLNEMGYDSAIIDLKNHNMVGIGGSPKDQYQNTGYIMIETTTPQPIGWISDEVGAIRGIRKIPGGGSQFNLNN